MMKKDRRQFLIDVSLTATAVAITSDLGASNSEIRRKVISCAPEKLFEVTGTISTTKSGRWSDPSVWSGGKIPGASDTPVIAAGHSIIFDLTSTTVLGVNVSAGATLSFDPAKSSTLQSSANVVVLGRLQMRPSSASVIHILRFTGINENSFVGGGMNVLASDIGLWVMGAGVADLAGTIKSSWTRASGSIGAGATSISVENAAGWRVGDEIAIAPTESPAVGTAFAAFDEALITSVSGNSVGLSKGTARSHPVVNGSWKAEVMNLTRNVRIEGTATGRAHIFIRSSAKQNISHTQFRYLGPRKDNSGDSIKELVPGRYGIHFHHCMDGSRGTLVDGNVMRDIGNHTYVPHISHGIKFTANIAYNVLETAFWWDPGDPTHDVIYDGNIVANCRHVRGSKNMNAENFPTFSSSGFALNTGDGNICNNNVVVAGGMGDPAEGGAYNWEAVINEGIWIFQNNIAHNNDCGLRVWQNSTRNHVIEDFISYHNNLGTFHGAYANSYTYTGGFYYGNANSFQVKAASANSNRVRIENITIDGANISTYGLEIIHSPLPGEVPVFVRNCTIKNCRTAAVLDSAEPEVHSVDLVQCNITGNIQLHPNAAANETIRVQPVSGQPYKITKAGKTNIAPFAAAVWGAGKGLKADYYNSTNFTNLAFSRLDSNISFTEWSTGVHHAITSNTYSVRWTGKVMAQYTEAYTFILNAGGAYRLWVNNQLILDSWAEKYPGTFASTPVAMEAGKQYDIKVEYFNNDKLTGMGLLWRSKSQLLEYVPQSQLYPAPGVPVTSPTANKAPVANAGADQTISLPTSSVSLTGVGSSDPEGGALKFAWVQVSGPSTATFSNASAVTTTAGSLVEGVYVFRLTVTDDKGATAADTVSITVSNSNTANKAPVANAGPDVTITLPNNRVTLSGGGTDSDGSIVKYAWYKVSGPAYSSSTPTASSLTLSNLVAGVYVFRLTVTDDKGATATDDVTITVNQSGSSSPVARAGNDIVVTAPTSSVTLNGSQSSDPDGSIVSYRWTRVSGPSSFNIVSAHSASTSVTELVPGDYVFRLTVTDNSGAQNSDDVLVKVNSQVNESNAVITLRATPNPFTSYFTLSVSSTSSQSPIVITAYAEGGRVVQQVTSTRSSASYMMGSTWQRGTYYVTAEQGTIRKVLTISKV